MKTKIEVAAQRGLFLIVFAVTAVSAANTDVKLIRMLS